MVKVLFVCIHNSARSQMAETFLNDLGKGQFTAESAGIEPGRLNPYVVKSMQERGYDISHNECHSVFDYFKEGREYDLVVKVCDQASGQRCPIFPSAKLSFNWGFPDPSEFKGSEEEILQKTGEVRDLIETRIREFINVFQVDSAAVKLLDTFK
ncbi:MAG: arsenate reductase ArsC [Eubacteriales bacterium]|nr:arsenate reductase ArsC [Eubacteriales bacterium]